ncbi:MAG: hypothetical protein JNM10_06275 [Planctomycetia bacterium]|nr:hypothetical protein [Planctomycetia bacterium]
MRTVELTCAIAFMLPLAVVGCGDAKDGSSSTPSARVPEAAHDHAAAPHGGELLELGEEEAHVELIHDPKAGSVTVYVFGKDAKTPVAVAAPTIVLATKDGPKEFTLTAVNPRGDGTADTWRGTHAGLTAEPLDGRIRVTVDGKAFQSPLESEGHGH